MEARRAPHRPARSVVPAPRRSRGAGLDLARRRGGAELLRLRPGASVRRRPAPGHRHRCGVRRADRRARGGKRLIRRQRSRRRPDADDPDAGRLCGDAAPPRLAGRRSWCRGSRGSGGRSCGKRRLGLPRCPARLRSAGLRRPARVPAREDRSRDRAAGCRAGARACAARHAGSSAGAYPCRRRRSFARTGRGACRRRCPDRHRARARRRSAAGRPACRRPSGARRGTCSGRLAFGACRPGARAGGRARGRAAARCHACCAGSGGAARCSRSRRPAADRAGPTAHRAGGSRGRSRAGADRADRRAGATARAGRRDSTGAGGRRAASHRHGNRGGARQARQGDATGVGARCESRLRWAAEVVPRRTSASGRAVQARAGGPAADRRGPGGSSCSHVRAEDRGSARRGPRATPCRRRPPPEGALGDSRGGGRAPRRRRSRPPRRGGCRGPPSYHPDA